MPYKDIDKRKSYHKEYNRKWYIRNKVKRRAELDEYNKNRYKHLRAIVHRYLRMKGCLICGYSKCPQAMDFHHVDPKEKDMHVSKMVGRYSWTRTKKEMSKCIILCANCRRELHAE